MFEANFRKCYDEYKDVDMSGSETQSPEKPFDKKLKWYCWLINLYIFNWLTVIILKPKMSHYDPLKVEAEQKDLIIA